MVDDQIKDDPAMNDASYFYHYFPTLCEITTQFSNLSEVASYRVDKCEAVLLFSRL